MTNDKKNIEAIYPLSPAQNAFLIHHLQPGQPDVGFLQIHFMIRGDLHIPAFKEAWQQVIRRHAALRTTVHWDQLDKPLQVVRKQVALPWEQHDWQETSEDKQQQQLAGLLQEDRARGLSFSQAPVMRLTLVQCTPATYRCVWSCHHLLLDGWSGAIVLGEVLTIYESIIKAQDAPRDTPPPYQNYITWLKKQDITRAESFWRQTLNGFATPTPLGISARLDGKDIHAEGYEKVHVSFSPSATDAILHFTKHHHITLNTILQGTWALLLSRYSGRNEVVFGTTLSGRPPELAGIESMVGLFVNTLPMRVRIASDDSLGSWLYHLQMQQAAMIPYAYTSLMQVQSWSDIPGRSRLFDSLIVFENYPWRDHTIGGERTLDCSDFHGPVATSYPLTIIAHQKPALSLQIIYDRRMFTQADIAQTGTHIQTLLHQMTTSDGTLAELLPDLEVNRHTPPLDQQTPSPDRPTPDHPVLPDAETSTTPIEALLTSLWKEVLDVTHIDPKDNFFELGGYSLTVVQLFSKMETILGKSLPLATIFEAPTIEQMAALIQRQDWAPSWTSLITIQPNGSKPPIFFTHTYLGNILGYARIASYLGKDQPFYGLQAQAIHDQIVVYRTVEEMAADYIEEIRQIQPEGPYYLGAFSYGLVAFEMAQQLQHQGQEVAHLIILEAFGPGYQVPTPKVRSQRNFRTRLAYYWREIASRGLLTTPAYVVRGLANRLKALWTRRVLTYYQKRERPLPRDLHAIQVEKELAQAAKHYSPHPYPGKITLLTSRNMPGDETLGWKAWAQGGVDVYFISEGAHHQFIAEPRVREVVAHLKDILATTPDHHGKPRAVWRDQG